MISFRSSSFVLAIACAMAGCVENIDISFAVKHGADTCKRGDLYSNLFIVTTYEPVRGSCCVPSWNGSEAVNPCTEDGDVIEEHCFESPDVGVSAGSVNTALLAAGLRLEDWDPDRPTCVRVVALFVEGEFEQAREVDCKTDPRLVDKPETPSSEDWQSDSRLERELRLCTQTSEPAVGTEAVLIEQTNCTRRIDPSNPNPDPDAPIRAERALALDCAALGKPVP